MPKLVCVSFPPRDICPNGLILPHGLSCVSPTGRSWTETNWAFSATGSSWPTTNWFPYIFSFIGEAYLYAITFYCSFHFLHYFYHKFLCHNTNYHYVQTFLGPRWLDVNYVVFVGYLSKCPMHEKTTPIEKYGWSRPSHCFRMWDIYKLHCVQLIWGMHHLGEGK